MSLNKKRKFNNNTEDVYLSQIVNKTNKIQRQLVDCIINYDKYEHNIFESKINNINLDINVKDYNVKIISNNENKSIFSCTCSSLSNYNNFYCKHIAMAIKELIKLYINENIKYMNEKKDYDNFKENIDFLNTNIARFNISDNNNNDEEF